MTTIICHPENARLLRESLREKLSLVAGLFRSPILSTIGIHIREDSQIPVEQPKDRGWTKYHFPKNRFVEYGPEDLAWMVPLGLASVEHEMERVFYLIDEDRLPDPYKTLEDWEKRGCLESLWEGP